jgi:cation transport regulator
MPYESNQNLPEQVKNNLPEHAQDIYREAYNSAWDDYKDPEKRRGDSGHEATAHKVAWSAVETKYKKNESGNWVQK